jgi:hypothetical protein
MPNKTDDKNKEVGIKEIANSSINISLMQHKEYAAKTEALHYISTLDNYLKATSIMLILSLGLISIAVSFITEIFGNGVNIKDYFAESKYVFYWAVTITISFVALTTIFLVFLKLKNGKSALERKVKNTFLNAIENSGINPLSKREN